jgi:hypothetical protein
MLVAVAALAVFLALERLLFQGAVWTLTSPLPTEHVYFADAVVLWVIFNVGLVAVLGPILGAMKWAGCFDRSSGGWSVKAKRVAKALMVAPAGAVIGAILGFILGSIVGFALDPGSNPHNFDGIFRGFVMVAGTVTGAVLGAVAGFIVGLVRSPR